MRAAAAAASGVSAPAGGCFHRGCAPHSLFGLAQKENAPRPVEEKKALRRVGLRPRRPPAAGGGWLALPCRSQGRKRPALGEAFGPGKSGIHPASLFAAADLVVDEGFSIGQRNTFYDRPGSA